jgi:dihydrolipoamide dehydrogenase
MADYDLIIIGAGPGGYVAAIRAAQLGMKTAIVERDTVGGICLNWGCIPSKALLHNAEVLNLLRRADEFGFSFENLGFDFGKAIDRSRSVVRKLTLGVAGLLKKNGVVHLDGQARIQDNRHIEIMSSGQVIEANNIIVATGARSRPLQGLPVDGRIVVTSREALELKELPDSVVIVGGGATGVEFAYLYNTYGVRVTVVEALPHLLPNEDQEISQHLERNFTKRGISILTNSQVDKLSTQNGRATLRIQSSEGEQEIECGQVLVAVGISPNSDDLGLESLGVLLTGGFIDVDKHMATNVPGIYAIGDVTGKLLLAHVASAQGIAAVEGIAGHASQDLNYELMPRAVYCQPQVTAFGISERQAAERGIEIKVGKFPFQANGKALAMGEQDGLVKLIVHSESGEILGAHMVGTNVTELLGELTLARLLDGTTMEVGSLVNSHPTMSEAIKEAALAADGRAIHI